MKKDIPVTRNEPESTGIPVEGSVWVHRKGGKYRILCIARSSNDWHQLQVVYQSLYPGEYPEGTVWVRTLTEFMEPGRFTLEQ